MTKYNDFPQPNKPTGGGFRRFLILVAMIASLSFMIAAWAGSNPMVTTETHVAHPTVTTAAPQPPGVAVNVQQSAPAVSVAIEQAPAPPTNDNTVALLAYQNADRALHESRSTYELTAALYPRVALLETAVAAPPTPSTELQLLRFDTDTNRAQTTILTAAFFALVAIVMALAVFISWSTSRPTHPTSTPPQTTPAPTANQHRANTVQHGVSTVQSTTTSEGDGLAAMAGDVLQPLQFSQRRPNIPRRADELTPEQRRYIQHTYNRLKTFSGTSRYIWNYHNATTLNCVKSVVDSQQQNNNLMQ